MFKSDVRKARGDQDSWGRSSSKRDLQATPWLPQGETPDILSQELKVETPSAWMDSQT